MTTGKFISAVLGAALVSAVLTGCDRRDLEDAAYAGGKLIYDTLKAISNPPDD